MSTRTVFDTALKAFLLLSPVFFFRDCQPSYARGMFFVFASFVLFGISLGLEPKRRFFNPWLALFLLWALIRVFVGGDFGSPASEWFNFWLSSAGFIYVFAGVLLFHTVYCHAEDPKNYLKPILIVCTMNLVLVIAQLTGHDFMWRCALNTSGFFGIGAQLGQYSAMSLPILVFISPWFLIIPLFTLFAAKSIAPIIALVMGVIFLGWQKRVKWAILLLIIPFVLGHFNHRYIVIKWQCRPIIWERTLRATMKRPYIGSGYNSFTDVVLQPTVKMSLGKGELSRVHCDPLHTAQEIGIPAVILIGGFFVGLWKKFRAKKDKDRLTYFLAASVLIVLVNCCGQTLIRYASLAGTFIVLLAFLSIKLQGEENGHNN